MSRAQSLRELKFALKRDLEWLLNTRRTIDPAPDSARETARSVYHYGFADVSSKSVLSARDHADLVRDMESAIAEFEPRLKRARVRMEPVEGAYRMKAIKPSEPALRTWTVTIPARSNGDRKLLPVNSAPRRRDLPGKTKLKCRFVNHPSQASSRNRPTKNLVA